MKVIVYGLGIIGASICASLKRAGYSVYGRNRSREPIEYALSHGMIDGAVSSYEEGDLIFLALPPTVAMRELDEGEFPDGCVVCDICGVKEEPERVVLSRERNYRYIGIHPMAGKATTGISSASETLFDGANLVIAVNEKTDSAALDLVKKVAKDMRFGKIIDCFAHEHDEMIALTSQLAHIVSSAYIADPLAACARGFTGGSFQDMVRVAPMDDVWKELFLLNRKPLLSRIEHLRFRLSLYEDALRHGDEEEILSLIREGKTDFERLFGKDA